MDTVSKDNNLEQYAKPTVNMFLVVTFIGLARFAENIYTPFLTEIQKDLHTGEHNVQWTISSCLLGFGVGNLFFGIISDKYGRKSCLIWGLIIFILGCFLCYISTSIGMLMIGRFIQGFGGTISSVITQSMVRDIYIQNELRKKYALISSTRYIFPLMGPLVGEILIIFYDWHAVFLILTICGLIMLFISIYEVKETLPKKMRIRNIEIKKPLIRIANDKELITNTISIGLIIGLISAYYIEAPFLIIKIFNLSRKHYEFSMIFILIGGLIGGYLSKKLTDNHNAIDLANKASTFSVIISAIFLTTIYLLEYCGIPYNNPIFLIITITSLTLLVTSNAITSSQVQAIALQNYSNSIGITTAFFNAGYVIIGSAITYMIGLFHTSSIFYMPFIFFTICVLMFLNSIKMRELQTKYF